MANPVYLKDGRFSPSPETRVIRAREYADIVAAEDLVARARAEAERILREAAETYEAEKQRGYQEGLAEGKMEMAMTMLDSLTAGVDYLAGIESTMVELVMSAVGKIIDGFSDEERVLGIIRKSLAYVRSQKRVTLRVCPEDGDIVTANLASLESLYAGIDLIDVVPDPRMQPGDCILESEMGLINAGLATQLEGIRRAFARKLQRPEEQENP